VAGLEIYGYAQDPSNPSFDLASGQPSSAFLNTIHWLLIEDCKFNFSSVLIQNGGFGGAGNNVTFRRNIIVDSWNLDSQGFSEGMFVFNIASNFVLDENLFDHNGWNASVAGAGRRIFNRNFYYQMNNAPIASANGNIFARSSAEGAQFRAGGVITNNLFVRNAKGFDIGHSGGDGTVLTTRATVTNNVVEESDDIDANNPRGGGMSIYNSSGSGAQITNNIVAHSASANPVNVFGIGFDTVTTGISVTNNIFCDLQGRPAMRNASAANITTPNIIGINTCNNLGFSDPNRTVGTYDTTLGGPGTFEDFMARARLQSKGNWNTALTAAAVNDYIRAGFGVGTGKDGAPRR